MKTKDKILSGAKDLYNEKGYSSTTTRDIAKHIDISPGNLHYHFPHSNEILEALFESFAMKMNELLETTSISDSSSIELLYNYIEQTTSLIYEYKFLFINFTDILRENLKINNMYKEIHSRRRVEFERLFTTFQNKKIFRDDIPEFIFSNLIEQMFIIGDNAISYNEVTHSLKSEKAIKFYTNIFITQFYYLLTDEHQKKFKEKLNSL
ncbi:TetR/AcrR family transcriptional regulator [Chryseobacterium salipaludis]|uniref:TetR/AcrR family transcriptional regulator n=1 Tax=Chryseobacterium TaxID=59732 RepID=UPI001FF3E862|nr:TetR/AcrR family transcriptional regulator [Planobacterium sp. JC490]MCJ8498072.1 TetR/AcrR family transcriptional regulator [Chryseobacterium salipaludis]MCX3296729.1 TetR/AcrR family transcriptional regulator [Planobacterium sp. JC490]